MILRLLPLLPLIISMLLMTQISIMIMMSRGKAKHCRSRRLLLPLRLQLWPCHYQYRWLHLPHHPPLQLHSSLQQHEAKECRCPAPDYWRALHLLTSLPS